MAIDMVREKIKVMQKACDERVNLLSLIIIPYEILKILFFEYYNISEQSRKDFRK